MDLLAGIIPIICNRHQDVDFLIGGDGPKCVLLEEVREKHCLQDRVKMLGMLQHTQVRNVLVQGDIFLNTSITEAFCIAIIEAACCGLQVVSTSVGGVPEVLPPDLIHLAEATVPALVNGLEVAIAVHREGKFIPPEIVHQRVRDIYTWSEIAERTEKVYNAIVQKPILSTSERLEKLQHRAPIAGIVYVIGMVIILIAHFLLNWIRPAKLIDRVPRVPPTISQRNQFNNDL